MTPVESRADVDVGYCPFLSSCLPVPFLLSFLLSSSSKAPETQPAFLCFSEQPPILLPERLQGDQLPSSHFLDAPNKYTGPFHCRVLLLITLGTDAGEGGGTSHKHGGL